MKFQDFEKIMTSARMSRYKTACAGNSKRATTLYRKNRQLSQELFTVISCFEIALRNAIDQQLLTTLGNDWLRDSAVAGGIFDNHNCRLTKTNINDVMQKLNHLYTTINLLLNWVLVFGATCLPPINIKQLVEFFFKYFQRSPEAPQPFRKIKILFLIS